MDFLRPTSRDDVLISPPFTSLGGWLMVALLREGFPLRQIVRSLLLNTGLRMFAMRSRKFLCNRVLDLNRFDGFDKWWKGLSPGTTEILARAENSPPLSA